MSSDNPKTALLTQFASVAKALGHAHRLELLEFVAQGERSVDALARQSGLSVANTSQHLIQLRRAGLLAWRQAGKRVLYRLAEDSVLSLTAALRRVAERNVAEVKQIVDGYFCQRDALEPVSRQELLEKMEQGLVTVLDVRPEDEYGAGHVSGALNIGLAELENRLSELPAGQEIVAYCRGAYCVLSFEAVAALRAHGFNVRRLEDGFPEWRVAGLPVETGSAVV
jgi:rhodanese-related sulfurtransferase/DNA-binding transcriptional ArsR family regulator